MADLLKIEKFSLCYNGVEVLHNISLSVPEHKITTLIGPSGCGKTTLLKSINGLLHEDSSCTCTGNIFFNGTNITELNDDSVRTHIGLVFQEPTPFPMSIEKNITYALHYHGITDKRILKNIVTEKLQCVHLYDEVHNTLSKNALKLSGGQMQRLCIARALAIEPKLLLLDEPCSNLDVQNTKAIENSLVALKEKYTFLLVTHSIEQARRIADVVVFMNNGTIVETADAKKFFDQPMTEEARAFVYN